ncbi:30S ribosomal protein S4 [Candidatus Saganbacteria bacterium]|nr:30S ribosomal protein S4 [Candidatus Saganbacteria bacterium]
MRLINYCKQCRREGEKLFLKGERCLTPKCAVARRAYPPGPHGEKPTRLTEFGRRMREKQKARRIYGLNEKQFRNYFEQASRATGVTGLRLLQLLEMRLDNVVYRLGYAPSRQAARQLVRHGFIKVNGRKVNIPSFQAKVGQVVGLRPERLEKIAEKLAELTPPAWLSFEADKTAKVVGLPTRDDTEKLIEDSAIVEYYSR